MVRQLVQSKRDKESLFMTDLVIVVVLALICGAAIRYIYKAKKSGAKCIGCAAGKSCGGSCSGCGTNNGRPPADGEN